MKKLIILTAILFVSAGVAFCQSNDAHIQQANRNDQASIRQDGRANSAQVGQGKADNLLDVDGNIINNIDPGTARNNEITIHQVQNNNYSAVLQGVDGGIALNNRAKVLQNGNQNVGSIAQGGDDGRATGNEATITQTGNRDGTQGTRILQGEQGTAIGNEATFKQAGNRNFGTIEQGFVGGAAIGNKATFIQNGNGNRSTFFQNVIFQGTNGGTARNSTARIRQDGNGNDAVIAEGFGSGVRAINSHAFIHQLTGNNQASIDISGVGQNASIVQN